MYIYIYMYEYIYIYDIYMYVYIYIFIYICRNIYICIIHGVNTLRSADARRIDWERQGIMLLLCGGVVSLASCPKVLWIASVGNSHVHGCPKVWRKTTTTHASTSRYDGTYTVTHPCDAQTLQTCNL